MWTHPKLKATFTGNYEMKKNAAGEWHRVILLEHRNTKGKVIGKVYEFTSHNVAKHPATDPKKGGWTHVADK